MRSVIDLAKSLGLPTASALHDLDDRVHVFDYSIDGDAYVRSIATDIALLGH